MMTPSPRRSTAISRSSHSILRKAGFVITAAAFPLILRLPKYRSVVGLFSSSPDIDRLSPFKKGPDAFVEIFRTAATERHLVDPLVGSGHVPRALALPRP